MVGMESRVGAHYNVDAAQIFRVAHKMTVFFYSSIRLLLKKDMSGSIVMVNWKQASAPLVSGSGRLLIGALRQQVTQEQSGKQGHPGHDDMINPIRWGPGLLQECWQADGCVEPDRQGQMWSPASAIPNMQDRQEGIT